MHKYIITITVLLYIEFFGAYDAAESLIVRGMFKAYDLCFVLSILPLLVNYFRGDRHARAVMASPLAKVLAIFALLVVSVSVNTFIQGGISVRNVLQVSRNYMPYFLALPIMYDIVKHQNSGYYRQVIILIALAAVLILTAVSVFSLTVFDGWPKLTHSLDQDGYIEGLSRVYFPAFVFPVLAFMIKGWEYLATRSGRDLFGVSFFGLGLFLQGFRAYIIGTLLALAIVFFAQSVDLKKNLRAMVKPLSMLAVIYIFTSYMGMSYQGLTDRVGSGVTDLINVDGTFAYRILDDAFRWSLFLDNKWLGVGMLHLDSARAAALGIQNEGFYALESTDSGYLSILVRFGIAGAVYFFAFTAFNVVRFISLGRCAMKTEMHAISLAAATLLLTVAFTQISHAGFTGMYGMIPLALMLGLTEGGQLSLRLNAETSG